MYSSLDAIKLLAGVLASAAFGGSAALLLVMSVAFVCARDFSLPPSLAGGWGVGMSVQPLDNV